MNIIIPIGGVGRRFSEAGFTNFKPMIQIGKKKILGYLLDCISIYKNEEDSVFIIFHSLMIGFRDWITENYPFIRLIEMEEPTKGSVQTILNGFKSSITIKNVKTLILDCDAFYNYDIFSGVRDISDNAVFYFHEKTVTNQFSYLEMNNENLISKIREKNSISCNACTGAYFFQDTEELLTYCNKVIDCDLKFKDEYYTSCLIDQMIQDGKRFRGIPIKEDGVVFLGTPEQTKKFLNNLYLYCFDLDGTLVVTDEIYLNVWERLLPKINVDYNLYKKYIQGNDDTTVISTLNSMNDKETISRISKQKDEFFLESLDKIRWVDGAKEFLNSLYITGHDIFIITNSNRKVAESILRHLNIVQIIDDLIIGNECQRSKPYSDPYLEAIKKSRFNQERCFIFEDSKTGLLSARGVFPKCTIGIETSMSPSELKSYGADITIKSYFEAIEKIKFCQNNKKVEDLKTYILNSLQNKKIKKVVLEESKLKGGYIADVIEVELIYDTMSEKTVLKYESDCDTHLTRMAYKLDLFRREYYFYETIQKYITLKTPIFKGLVYDNNLKVIGVLMDNLKNKTIQVTAGIDNVDLTLKIISRLATMHSRFWNKDLEIIFPLLTKHNNERFKPFLGDFITKHWVDFKNQWSFMLDNDQLSIGQQIVEQFDRIQNDLSQGNLTLCHGDVKYGNILLDEENEPVFLDWQYVSIGKGIQDVVFFLIESYEIDVLRLYKDVFFQYYYSELIRNGVNYNQEEYYKDVKNAASFFPFFVALWFGTTPKEDLIDKNFPFFFIKKYFSFLSIFF